MTLCSAIRRQLSSLATRCADDHGVIGLVIALGLTAAAGALIATKVVQNERATLVRAQGAGTNFGKVEKALVAYAVTQTNQRLPCPSDVTGTPGTADAFSGNGCTNRVRGIVPFRTIGLSPDDVKDGYGNYLTYVVSTDVRMCNGASVRTGTVNDLDGGADYLFALISHGENGAGAWKGETALTEQNSGNMNTAEDGNCPSATGQAGCAVAATNQDVDSRVQNLTEGATYFDDTAYFPDATDRAYVGNCESFSPDPEGAVAGDYDPVNAQNYAQSTDDAGGDAPTIAQNLDTNGDSTNDTYSVTFTDSGSADATGQRSCLVANQTFPLNGYTIRFYTDFYAQADAGGTLGNGFVAGFIGGNDASSGSPVNLSATVECGGIDEFMGFASDSTNLFPNTWERIGLEIDTKNHRPGTPADGDIIDPDQNHVAIVLGDVDHYDSTDSLTDNTGETTEDRGPKCMSDTELTGLGLASPAAGSAPTADAGERGSAPTLTTRELAEPFPPPHNTASNLDDEGCVRISSEANWLEYGNPVAGDASATNLYNRLRIELHDGTGASNGCDSGFLRMDAWIWQSTDACTGGSDCKDLTVDYTGENPHVSQCIARPNALNSVRFALTSGIPSGADTEGDITLFRTGLNFVGRATKTAAATDYISTFVSEQGIRNGLYQSPATAPAGDLGSSNFEQSYAVAEQVDNTPDDIALFADYGIFALDENEGWGIEGVGPSDTEIDNITPGTGVYASNTDFLAVAEREKAVVLFNRLVRQVTVNLKDFADQEYTTTDFTTDETAPEMERIRLRAYNTNGPDAPVQVGSDQIVEACYDVHNTTATQFNGGNVAGDFGSIISTNFGGNFDRLEIIPEPILTSGAAQYLNSYSRFQVGGVRGCGSAEFCGLDAADSIQTAANETNSRCAFLTLPEPTVLGLVQGEEVDPDKAISRLSATSGTVLEHAWVELQGSPDLDVAVDTPSGQLIVTTNATLSDCYGPPSGAVCGFGVSSASGTNTNMLDTTSTPTDATNETDREKINFRFKSKWTKFAVGLGSFGSQFGQTDRARIRFYDGTTLVATYSPILETIDDTVPNCDYNGTGRGRLEVVATFASAEVDRIEITAMPNSSGNQSAFVVRGIQPCENGSDGGNCKVDYAGDDDNEGADNDNSDRFCGVSVAF